MNNLEKVKYFYEHVTSNHLLHELPEYISENCTVRIGEDIIPVGIEGMKQHMEDIQNNVS